VGVTTDVIMLDTAGRIGNSENNKWETLRKLLSPIKYTHHLWGSPQMSQYLIQVVGLAILKNIK